VLGRPVVDARLTPMPQRHSEYRRELHDFYIEPKWAVLALFDRVGFCDGLHDPCCGIGTIVDVAIDRGLMATGGDLVDRAHGRFPACDYLTTDAIDANIVTNPPFKLAVPIILHALEHVVDGGRVAVIAPCEFLYSQGRYTLFSRPECETIIHLSKRPNMPPGTMLEALGEACRKNGSKDFCWIVFRLGRLASEGPPHTLWAL
jgi:hypothetical protein